MSRSVEHLDEPQRMGVLRILCSPDVARKIEEAGIPGIDFIVKDFSVAVRRGHLPSPG
ncbi:hypothetical protein [Arvimicrobium flavum]|uniref:hypothetical protein n=1 Tax=Arvimicrobium flavum TaxID=3393320 RepID=UPI00237C508C|nr:hypothetical protein [Mesorhizobium shangrilense]